MTNNTEDLLTGACLGILFITAIFIGFDLLTLPEIVR